MKEERKCNMTSRRKGGKNSRINGDNKQDEERKVEKERSTGRMT